MKLSKSKIMHKMKKKTSIKRMGEEDIDETLRWYDQQIEKNPKDTGLFYAKSALLARDGRYEESILILDRIIDLDPDNQKVWYIKANTLYELQRYEEAIICFDRILEFAENDERVWYHKGEALSKLYRYKEAIECYDSAIRLDRNFSEAWLGRGNALRNLRSQLLEEEPETLDKERRTELEYALDNFTEVVEQDPNSEQAWLGMGDIQYDLRYYKEALPCYDKSVEIKPGLVKGWYGRGKTLGKLDRKKEALQSFETAICLAPNEESMEDVEDWVTKANSYYKLGRYDEALDCFDRILKKFPGNHYALEGKGDILKKLGRNKEALQCYKDAIDLDSNNVSGLYKKGAILSEMGDYKAALESYNKIIHFAPRFEEAWFRIGELLKKQNELTKAQECYSWILKINPDNEKVKKALKSMTEVKDIVTSDSGIETCNNNFIIGRTQKEAHNKSGKKRIKLLKRKKKEKSVDGELKGKIIANRLHLTVGASSDLDENDGEMNMQVKGAPFLIWKDFKEKLDDLLEFLGEKTDIPKILIEEITRSDEDLKKTNCEENATQDENITFSTDELIKNLDELQKQLDQNKAHIETLSTLVGPPEGERIQLKKLLIKGSKHLHNIELEEALDCFNRALELDPQYWDAWSRKGDVLLKMGKIDEACLCYKKAAYSSFRHDNIEEVNENLMFESSENNWRDTLISLIDYSHDNLGQVGELECGGDLERTIVLQGLEELVSLTEPKGIHELDEVVKKEIVDVKKVFRESNRNGEWKFKCPNCGLEVDLNERLCYGCSTTFNEEEFKNIHKDLDDDLVFFEGLKRILSSGTPTFVHLDATQGCLRYLEKRRDSFSGKFDYVIVRGEIEKLGWNYSSSEKEAGVSFEIIQIQ